MGPRPLPTRHRVAATIAAIFLAAALTACAGRPGGNDSPKQPGEQNPARNGPPYDY